MRRLLVGLAGVVVAAITFPPVHRWPPGPTPDQVALASEQARAADLQHQLDEATQANRRPRPIPRDTAALAALDDVRAQRDAAVARNMRPRPTPADPATEARVADLRRQNRDMSAELQAPRPLVVDGTQQARADDLAAQNDALTAQLERPRPVVVPPVIATLTKDQIIRSTHLFGLYTEQAPFSMAEVDLVQSEVGRKADIIGYFDSWTNPFRVDGVRAAWSRGQVPLLTWESQPQVGAITTDVPEFNLPSIINGDHDAYIHQYAHDIATLGLPLILRLDHEMNAAYYPWGEIQGWSGQSVNGNHRGDYVKMWRRVHDIFEQEGANQYVIWLWSPNRVNKIPSQPPPAEFYPGDTFVDWIGMSGYFRTGDEEPTFNDTYGPTLPLLRAITTKPLFLSEVGATEKGNHKPDWITSFFAGLADNPDIIGFGWFSHAVSAGGVTNDWRINSSSMAAQKAREGLDLYGYGKPIVP